MLMILQINVSLTARQIDATVALSCKPSLTRLECCQQVGNWVLLVLDQTHLHSSKERRRHIILEAIPDFLEVYLGVVTASESELAMLRVGLNYDQIKILFILT
jgi:hypothetical protein